MKGLTERQRTILDFIESYIASKQYSPSYAEIQKHFGFSSLGSVYKHIQTLKRKGHLTAESGCNRSLALPRHSEPITQENALPHIGRVSMGYPLETFLKWEDIAVPPHLVRDSSTSDLISVQGDEMSDDHFLSGDLLIVEAADDALPGDTVLSIIHDDECMIRRFFPEGIYTRLESSNPDVAPIVLPAEDVSIQGIIVGLMRSYI
jgi:repressor LexA